MVHLLSLSPLRILASVQKAQDCDTLHQARSRVAQELASGLECAINPDVMARNHVEVTRLGRVV